MCAKPAFEARVPTTSAPYSVQLDASVAHAAAQQGATLLLLDVPPSTYVGVDHRIFVVGDKFLGVKMIPPGIHYLSHADPGDTGFLATVSTFLHLKARQVLTRRWDAQQQALVDVSEEEAARYEHGVRQFDFDAGLAPYDLQGGGIWTSLTCHVRDDTLRRVLPVSGRICVLSEMDAADETPRTAAEARMLQSLRDQAEDRDNRAALADALQAASASRGDAPAALASTTQGEAMEADLGSGAPRSTTRARPAPIGQRPDCGAACGFGRCFYTPLPKHARAPGMTPQQLTAANADKTELLQTTLDAQFGGDWRGLMGEMQLAFVAFVMGQSLDGFAQWKRIVGLLLSCHSAATSTHLELVAAFLTALLAQLRTGLGETGAGEGGASFGMPLVDELIGDSFLKHKVIEFLGCLADEGESVPEAVATPAQRLKRLLEAHLGWNLDVQDLDEDDEYAPVVVEC